MSDNNVKVYIRFRNNTTDGKNACELVSANQVQVSSSVMEAKGQRPVDYSFDQIYDKSSTQQEVYERVGRPLLKNILEGFNSTLFVYGQTGSGKTFTMFGPDGGQMENPKLRGLVPRQMEELFKAIEHKQQKEPTTKFEVHVSICDIYLEKARDLLNKEVVKKGSPATNLKIRYNKKTGVYLTYSDNTPVTEKAVSCYSDIQDQIESAMRIRKKTGGQASTGMNEFSSRSHLVVMVKLKEITPDGIKQSKLMLCDLAGSEKVKNTKASGTTLKQAQNINYGLSVLGNVLNALTARDKRLPPFSDSKLTKILMDALGGNSKTSLICGCRPDDKYAVESRSTLRFGSNAKKIKNQAVQNRVLTVAQYKRLVAKQENEFAEAKKQLDQQIAVASAFKTAYTKAIEVAKEHNIQDDRIVDIAEIEKNVGSIMTTDDEKSGVESGVDEYGFAVAPKRASGSEQGALVSNAASQFVKKHNIRLQVQNRRMEEEMEDMRARLRAQEFHILNLENKNDDLNVVAEQFEEAKGRITELQGHLYSEQQNQELLKHKLRHLEGLGSKQQNSDKIAIGFNIREYDASSTKAELKRVMHALKSGDGDQVVEVVNDLLDQSAEIGRLRQALDQQKQMNSHFMELRQNELKQRNTHDQSMLMLFSKYKQDVGALKIQLAQKTERQQVLEDQIEKLKESRDLLKKRQSYSEGKLSLGAILKDKQNFHNLISAGELAGRRVSNSRPVGFRKKKQIRRKKTPPKINVQEGARPQTETLVSPSA